MSFSIASVVAVIVLGESVNPVSGHDVGRLLVI